MTGESRMTGWAHTIPCSDASSILQPLLSPYLPSYCSKLPLSLLSLRKNINIFYLVSAKLKGPGASAKLKP